MKALSQAGSPGQPLNGAASEQYGDKKFPTPRGEPWPGYMSRREKTENVKKNCEPWLHHFISGHGTQASQTSQFISSHEDFGGGEPRSQVAAEQASQQCYSLFYSGALSKG